MRTVRRTAAVTAAALSTWAAGRSADAALVVSTQSRPMTTTVITHAYNNVGTLTTKGGPRTYPDYSVAFGGGIYSDDADQAVTGSGFSPQSQTYVYNASAGVNEASGVTTTNPNGIGLSGSAVPTAASYQTGTSGTSEANASSGYLATFTVDVPTPIRLEGTLGGDSAYHLGPLEVVADSLVLSGSTAGTLFSRADNFTPIQTTGTQSYSDSFSFTAVLLPGQTYSLSVNAYTDSFRDNGPGETSTTGGDAAFNFSLQPTAVPEPATAGLIAIVGLGLSGRRRRR